MKEVVIVSAARTALGALLGNFKNTSAPELGAAAISKSIDILEDKSVIDQVIMGCVLSAGLGQSPARQASIYAGISNMVPCSNINKVCGSGMYAIMIARNAILAGDSDVIVAGGMENMTMAPYLLQKARNGYRFGHNTLVDHMVCDGLENSFDHALMGALAENAVKEYGFMREELDEYTKHSFEKAFKAYDKGVFANEITPVRVKDKKQEIVVDKDEPPFGVNLGRIPTLKPAFGKDGLLTAASSSSIADGAAALTLMSADKAKQLGIRPIAKIVAQACHAQDPTLFATAPIGAIKKVLAKSNWSIYDVDLFEINEAFAVVAMAAISAHGIDKDNVNIYGGACALGHPLGASGARIVVTLLNALRTTSKKKGLATLCVGGGEGTALTIEMC